MVQLVALALVGVLGWYGYNAFKKEMAKTNNQVRKAEKDNAGTISELEKDPETGVYKPKKRD